MKNPFSVWKIYIILLLSLSISGYLLFKALSEIHFIKVNDGTGTHLWKDFNNNQAIDFTLENEFYEVKSGNFRLKTSTDYLNEIQWTSKAFFCLLLAFFFVCCRDLAYMWRIKLLTKGKISWSRSLRVILLWEFASALSPGIVGGAAVAMFILKKEKISLGKSTSIVIITALMDNLFYLLLIPFLFLLIDSSSLFPNQFSFEKSVQLIFWSGYVIIFLLSIFLILGIFFFPKWIKSFLMLLFSLPILNKWKKNAEHTGNEIIQTSKEFKNEKKTFWLSPFFATILSWSSRYLVINCIIAGFIHLQGIQHIQILAKQVVMWLFLLISPTPGASGIAEFAFSELMQDLSSSLFLITTLAILWRLISYFPYLIVGSILLPFWLKKKRDE
ncbi:MAG: flippase-like domain-containing protein [Flavobacteriia bacterium]|nr:flippase-like domain-containing protein [Flavobacteriia bacterium]